MSELAARLATATQELKRERDQAIFERDEARQVARDMLLGPVPGRLGEWRKGFLKRAPWLTE